jgi:hypothetical protein
MIKMMMMMMIMIMIIIYTAVITERNKICFVSDLIL